MKIRSVIAPKWMAANAKRGLELRASQPPSNRGGTAVGLARARQLVNGEPLSLSTVKRMKSFIARHGGSQKSNDPKESKQRQALLLWGVDYDDIDRGIEWCDRSINKMEAT
jgi:hypothetical protein